MKKVKRRAWTIAQSRASILDCMRTLIGRTVVDVQYQNYEYVRWVFDDGSYQEWYNPCKGKTKIKFPKTPRNYRELASKGRNGLESRAMSDNPA